MRDHSFNALADRPVPARFVDALSEGVDEFVGHRCVYRLAHTAMEVPDLPADIRVGRVRLRLGHGPLVTQQTGVCQRAGDELVFDKYFHPYVPVGDPRPISLLEIEDTFPEAASDAFDRWRSEALAAAGVLAAVLDERLTQRPLFEDVLIFGSSGELKGATDVTLRLRHFVPYPVTATETLALESLKRAEVRETADASAARWYLRAAQLGPTADSIVFLWIALDALLGTNGDKVVPALKTRLEGLGVDPSTFPVSIGRLYGLRGDIVHGGREEGDHLRAGFYILEFCVRVLLRASLDLWTQWPEQVSALDHPDRNLSHLDGAEPKYVLHHDEPNEAR